MSEVADQYIRLGAVLKQGIEGLGQRAIQDAQLSLSETEMQAKLNDPRTKLARTEAQEELDWRGAPFDPEMVGMQSPLASGAKSPVDIKGDLTPEGEAELKQLPRKEQAAVKRDLAVKKNVKTLVRGVVGNNPHHQIHLALNLLPRFEKKFGWQFGQDGRLYKPTGEVVSNEDFKRTGARLMMKAYSSPQKYVEGEIAMVNQQLQGIDPSSPANQKTVEDLQKRKEMLMDTRDRMEKNPAGVAKMKLDHILMLSKYVNQDDYKHEIGMAELEYKNALENDIRSGKRAADSVYMLTIHHAETGEERKIPVDKFRQDEQGNMVPNTVLNDSPEMKDYRNLGFVVGEAPKKASEYKISQRLDDLSKHYGTPIDQLNRAINHYRTADTPNLPVDASAEDMVNRLEGERRVIELQHMRERERANRGEPTAYELGKRLDSSGFYVGERRTLRRKGKIQTYMYKGANKWDLVEDGVEDLYTYNPDNGYFSKIERHSGE